MTIGVIILIILAVVFISLMFMAHQAHMRGRGDPIYMIGLIMVGFVFFIVAIGVTAK